MSALEDALIGHDYRGASAWALAAAVAALASLALTTGGLIDLSGIAILSPQVHVLGSLLGGLLFGLGMTLVGTCSFGVLVRAGGGDLRALVTALTIGIMAFTLTTGVLAPIRARLLAVGILDLASWGGSSLDRLLGHAMGIDAARAVIAVGLLAIGARVIASRAMRQRPRLLVSAVVLGIAVAAGWVATTMAVTAMTTTRIESLSFVAPAGRALLQMMSLPFRGTGFGMAAVLGVVCASFLVAALRRELRWEAFDDQREMRRHLFGAALMGFGGVLAQGCTIGQGLTAASALAVTAPLFVVAMLVGARIGLKVLIEGSAIWRMGFSPRAD